MLLSGENIDILDYLEREVALVVANDYSYPPGAARRLAHLLSTPAHPSLLAQSLAERLDAQCHRVASHTGGPAEAHVWLCRRGAVAQILYCPSPDLCDLEVRFGEVGEVTEWVSTVVEALRTSLNFDRGR